MALLALLISHLVQLLFLGYAASAVYWVIGIVFVVPILQKLTGE